MAKLVCLVATANQVLLVKWVRLERQDKTANLVQRARQEHPRRRSEARREKKAPRDHKDHPETREHLARMALQEKAAELEHLVDQVHKESQETKVRDT